MKTMKKKTHKKKQTKHVVVGTILAAVAVPVSAYASLQPIDLPFDLPGGSSPQGRQSSGTWDEAIPSRGSQSSAATWDEAIPQIPPIISASKGIFRNISRGNVDGALDGVISILGKLGILNPMEEAARASAGATSASSDRPYSNPQTPKEVYDLQRHVDAVRSEIPQNLSQIVFGPQGQQALDEQSQAIEEAQAASQAGQAGAAQSYQKSAQQAQQNATYAANVSAEADKAQSATASQDVLKGIAAQNKDLARINSGSSEQLAQLGKAASYQSTQLSAANAQLAGLNDKSQTLEILSASQNDQMAQINGAIAQQNNYEHLKDDIKLDAGYQSSTMIYIPGLVPKGGTQ